MLSPGYERCRIFAVLLYGSVREEVEFPRAWFAREIDDVLFLDVEGYVRKAYKGAPSDEGMLQINALGPPIITKMLVLLIPAGSAKTQHRRGCFYQPK